MSQAHERTLLSDQEKKVMALMVSLSQLVPKYRKNFNKVSGKIETKIPIKEFIGGLHATIILKPLVGFLSQRALLFPDIFEGTIEVRETRNFTQSSRKIENVVKSILSKCGTTMAKEKHITTYIVKLEKALAELPRDQKLTFNNALSWGLVHGRIIDVLEVEAPDPGTQRQLDIRGFVTSERRSNPNPNLPPAEVRNEQRKY